jgi:hypothetical protein
MYDAYRADLETKVGITSDKVTPIHLCETLELVSKKLVSEYLLYFENCADNATPHMQLPWEAVVY